MCQTLPLRDYQRDTLAAIAAAEAEGCRRQLVVLPAGSGRSVVCAHLLAGRMDADRCEGRALVLAHRDDMLAQSEERLRTVWPDAPLGVVRGRRDEIGARIVLASVQTLVRPGRLERYVRAAGSGLRLVVTEEAQHAVAPSYRRIQAALGIGTAGGPLHVGFAAAASRADGVGLGAAFDRVVFALDAAALVRAGWLVPPRVRVVACGGEGDAAERIAEAWLRWARERPTLALLPSAALAAGLAAAINRRAGRTLAASVTACTPPGERTRLLRGLESGELGLLASGSACGEGLAVPAGSCLLLARRFGSDATFTQAVGRGLRPWPPHKRDCLVLDLTGSSADRSLHPPVVLFGRVGRDPASGGPNPASGCPTGRRPAAGRLTLAAADGASDPLRAPGALAWTEAAPGVFLLGLPPAGHGRCPVARDLVVRHLADGRWAAEALRRPLLRGDRASVTRLWTSPAGSTLGRATAFGAAETYLANDRAAHRFAAASAAWRRRPAPASRAQLALLRQLGVPAPAGLGKAGASGLITACVARRRLAPEIREAAQAEGKGSR